MQIVYEQAYFSVIVKIKTREFIDVFRSIDIRLASVNLAVNVTVLGRCVWEVDLGQSQLEVVVLQIDCFEERQ